MTTGISSSSFPPGTPPGHDACGTGFLADRTGRARADILPLALEALARMEHRGGVGADGETGDGAGILTAIPWGLVSAEAADGGVGPGLGLGQLFLPPRAWERSRAIEAVRAGLGRAGLTVRGWREVKTHDAVLGRLGRESKPSLAQVIVGRPADVDDESYERRLFVARREIEALSRARNLEGLYVCSLSHRTVVYKALLRASQLGQFYADLKDPRFATPFAVFHNRFSTNTHPSWARTQPFRQIAHNGEINTIEGNRRWMEARGLSGAGRVLGLSEEAARPLLSPNESDSASLDEAMRLLTAAGRSTLQALALLIPPAWENDADLRPATRRFYESASRMMEPWDGPALVAFSDGRTVGAALDRNGLRPARWVTTVDDLVMVASEAGVLARPDHEILERGRLGPGGLLAVDLAEKTLIDRTGLERALGASAEPLPDDGDEGVPLETEAETPRPLGLAALGAFGYTREELQFVVGPMARDGAEPIGSMGDDTPLACLSERPGLLFSFFKQRFAQVTNPPIDPLRERLVMSLRTMVGPLADPFAPSAKAPRALDLPSPILSEAAFLAIRALPDQGDASVSLLFRAAPESEAGEMERALERVLAAAVREARAGASRVILSDRGVEASHAAIPSLLAVSAVHQRLVLEGLRLRTGLVVETGEARDDHQIAALLAFGANAVCPYGVFEATRRWIEDHAPGTKPEEALRRVVSTLEKGLLKILSKMGIATLRSYQGAQLFEVVGLDHDLVARHFTGTPARLEGHGLPEIENDVRARHAQAFHPAFSGLDEGGAHRYRRSGEAHAYEPPVVKALHALIRTGERLDSRRYSDLVGQRAPIGIRDLLQFLSASDPRASAAIDLGEVEPTSSLFARFSTAAMSLGSLSPEAHEALAIAMNRTAGQSNSGEGGEPEENYWRRLPGGDDPNHRIKQVASARFGVTVDYLVSADELQIKMAQGSKPGEGGQLPGRKVVAHIARVRHASEGVTLISPPPHHDIYSIEDLAQLIHDLKRVNPRAAVSVKLVSSAGIGAIAAGVAKAGADTIVIGGHDGGTGASPLSSIKNAGTPWELGLLEVQQTLVEEGLRGRVRLRVEGGLKTGHDVVMAAALGGDEFAFGSAALVAAGCVMARQCHLNTCPVGIATQRAELRRQFRGTPEQAIRFLTAVGEEAREVLASLGKRNLAEIVGDLGLLEPRPSRPGRASRVSAGPLLAGRFGLASPGRTMEARNGSTAESAGLDESVLSRLRFVGGRIAPLRFSRAITVADRSVGARTAGEIARLLRGRRLDDGTIRLHFRGAAGQSFGAFAVSGMSLFLEGEANDYVGKGLSGGEIAIRPRRRRSHSGDGQVIAGNTLLYGATSGRMFIAGRVGERFAVRLSGAVAVVEGAGDHACEYMTAGTVAILGPVGRNFGAGMSGGLAYVHDPLNVLATRINEDMVLIAAGLTSEDETWLKEACRRHWEATASPRVEALLEDWSRTRQAFRRVAPLGASSIQPTPWPMAEPSRRDVTEAMSIVA